MIRDAPCRSDVVAIADESIGERRGEAVAARKISLRVYSINPAAEYFGTCVGRMAGEAETWVSSRIVTLPESVNPRIG